MKKCTSFRECELYRKNENLSERIEKLSETIINQRNELRILNQKESKKEDPILKAIIRKKGTDTQCKKAIEEMSELIKEICKNFEGKENSDAIAEEIADVEIMLDQLKMIFGLKEKVKAYRLMKIKRMVDRLNT